MAKEGRPPHLILAIVAHPRSRNSEGKQLLFKGNDFTATGLQSAVPPKQPSAVTAPILID